jgi:hypothetical protein
VSPYRSKAQQGYFHAHAAELERQGVNVHEWDQASKGKQLPMKTKKDGTDAMTTPKAKEGGEGKPKGEHHKAAAPKGAELHSITTRKLHDGSFAHEHHYKDKHGLPHHVTHEYSSADINDHMQEHMGGGPAQPAGDQGEGQEGDEQDATGQAAQPQASQGGAGAPAEQE